MSNTLVGETQACIAWPGRLTSSTRMHTVSDDDDWSSCLTPLQYPNIPIEHSDNHNQSCAHLPEEIPTSQELLYQVGHDKELVEELWLKWA